MTCSSAVCGLAAPAPAAAARGGGTARSAACRLTPAARPRRRTGTASLNRRELLGSGAEAAAIVPAALGAAAAASAAAASAATAAAPAGATTSPDVELRGLSMEVDSKGVTRLALQPEGWNTWRWRGHDVNWLAAGQERGPDTPVVLLVHGFGASVYHWRYNVPELAKTCKVYALDCLGFGWSSKPLVEYSGCDLWTDQIADFCTHVVGGGRKVVLVGNSLGGYNALATAARRPDLVRGVVLINAAGRFEESPEGQADTAVATEEQQSLWSSLVGQVRSAVKRAVVFASFVFTKQPARIRQVLGQVYVSPANIDGDLVRSIALPADHPNAAEVFYRVITARGEAMNRLLGRLDGMPLYLLWGDKDPWCVPARADQIQRYYPSAARTDMDSGHCPHDDTPDLVNSNLLRWLSELPPERTA